MGHMAWLTTADAPCCGRPKFKYRLSNQPFWPDELNYIQIKRNAYNFACGPKATRLL